MNEIGTSMTYRRLRAPQADGTALFDPPLSDEDAFLRQNVARREQAECDVCGARLGTLRAESRQQLLRQARQFTTRYRDHNFPGLSESAPIILAGHQPELVHPGVWFKNFVLSQLARRTQSHAVNLLIDNDSVRSTSIRVPGGSVDDPTIASVPFDLPAEPIPYEQRLVRDTGLFVSCGRRVADKIGPLVPHPLIRELWPIATEAVREHGNLGRALAQSRHVLEGAWGLSTLELPLSVVCDDQPFRWFSAHLLAQAVRLREVHNACLADYRSVHGVRGHTHPVPDLMQYDDWTEVPFWLWSADRPLRRAAFVRQRGSQVIVSDRRGTSVALDLTVNGDAERAVDQLGAAHAAGIRLRPRALITTMFARLVLSDIFVHGIGGAKYDQVTDAIVRRFFGIEPPEYLVATATLKLPVPRGLADPEDLSRIDRTLRDLRYHPERHVESTPETRVLMEEKRRWIAHDVPVDLRRERHERIQRVNETLSEMLDAQRRRLVQQRAQLRCSLRKQAILDSREYAFCLFPTDSLRHRLLDLSRQEP